MGRGWIFRIYGAKKERNLCRKKGKQMSDRVGLNLQSLATSALTGIGTYTFEITRRLQDILGENYVCEGQVFDFGGRNHAVDRIESYLSEKTAAYISTKSSMIIRSCRLFPLGAYIRAGRVGSIVSYQQLLGSEADTTVFFNYIRPDRVEGKSIITVYDMVCVRFPETMDKRNRRLLRRFLARSCQKADAVITISEFSKREIAECLKISPDKIHVALCGIDPQVYYPPIDDEEKGRLKDRLLEKFQIPPPYILYLGTLEPRKNVDVLLDAFVVLHDRFPELKLVICGGLGWQYERTLVHMDSLGLQDFIIRTGYVAEQDKRMIYAGAEVFVFPSLYEGFGLPVAEAMACGTPVVCSRSSSLPEVVGDAGLLCDPNDAKAFADAVGLIYLDTELQDVLKSRMKEQILPFTWEGAAQVYGQVIADVVKSHR